jgi:predicted component of type VI protein secretion system
MAGFGNGRTAAPGREPGSSRFRLRYLHHDLELGTGEFSLGRSADCQLSLDDPLVSRRHALLVVGEDGVTIEDLQSRNGVSVNGEPVAGKAHLVDGDRILIGSQELTLHAMHPDDAMDLDPDLDPSEPGGFRTLPKITAVRPAERPRQGTARPGAGESEATTERRADAFSVLGGVAEKALAMGRAEEAERLLSSTLADVIEACRSGRPSPSLVEMAARFAAKLASGTGKGSWVDYVVEVYHTQGRPCSAAVIDELYSALRKVSAIDLVALRAYVAQLRERQATLGPAEKFLLQRIEGLERLAALR